MTKTRLLKPTATIHIANRFSLVERKVLNALIWNCQRHNVVGGELAIEAGHLLELIGFGASKNVATLKDALRRLVGTTIEWNVLGQDRAEEWGVCTFLSSAKVMRGQVRYRLNPEIAERIRNPTLFAKIQLLMQTRFTSKHSLVLYEYLIDGLSREKSGRLEIKKVPLGTVHRLLGFDGTEYSGSYKFFNRDVLKPSFDEINRLTDIDVSYTPTREHRRVVALRLKAERKSSYQMAFDLPETLNGPLPSPVIRSESDAGLVTLMVAAGVGEKRARVLVGHYEADRIRRNLRYAREQEGGSRHIKNMGAYVARAIEEDYAGVPAPAAPSIEAGRERFPHEAERRKTEEEKLRREFEGFRDRRCREAYAARGQAWREARQRAFVDKLLGKDGPPLLVNLYRKDGFASPIVEAVFLGELLDELLTRPEETSFEAYLTWRQAQNGA